MKKLVSLLLGFALAAGTLGLFAGCSTEEPYDPDNFLPNGTAENPWQIVAEPVTIDIFVPTSSVNPPYSDMKMFKVISEMTNLQFNFTEANVSAYENLRNMAWGDERSRPDLFLFNNNVSEQIVYSQLGVLTPFNSDSFVTATGAEAGNLIDNYMPNYKALLEDNFGEHDAGEDGYVEQASDVVTLDDGYMYATLTVNNVPRDLTYKMFINKQWIDNYNTYYAQQGEELPQPEDIRTWEQLVEVLRAFRDYDVNRNGNANDEIPVSSAALNFLRNYCLQSCGYVTPNYEITTTNTLAPESEIVYVPKTDAYREYLRKMKALYDEGLLDNCFSATDDTLVVKGHNHRLGMFQAAAAYLVVGQEYADEYVTIAPVTSEYYQGDPIQLGFPEFAASGAVIPASSPYVREVARLLDLMYSELGCQLIAYGLEGEDWEWDLREDGTRGDGSLDTDTWTFHVPDGWYESGKTQEDYRATITPNVGTANALYWNYDFVGKMNDPTITALNRMSEIYMDYLKVPIPSAIKMTEEEYNMRAVYESTLQNYVETAERSFIVGDSGYDVESDTDWNAYVQRLVGYRCDDLLKCYNDALARYKQSKS